MASRQSVLIITEDSQLSGQLIRALDRRSDVRVDAETATLDGMNGRAVEMVRHYDLVLFQTSADSAADLRALQTLRAGRPAQTRLVALADDSLSLAGARALTEAGADEVMPLTADGATLGPDVLRWLDGRAATRSGPGRPARIIAVAQARGGIGATTVAVNLADMLAGSGRRRRKQPPPPRVALLDFDLQFGTVGSYLDIGDQDGLLQLATDGILPDATFMEQAMVRLPGGLDVLAAPQKFAPLDSLTAEQVSAILDTLRQTHDYIVIDLPRALVGWLEPVVQAADELVLVTDVSVASVRHCRRLAEFFTANNVALTVEVVVNHQRRPLFSRQIHREAAKVIGRPLTNWLPDDRAALSAADRGKPLSQVAPRSALGKAIGRLAAATAARFAAGQTQPQK